MENGSRNDPGGRHEPVYLLSLDGGGVRGISEAVILHEIMTRIQKELGLTELPKPCDYFHLIGGTSTGGLIAIMLGRLRMSTQEVIDEYMAISRTIFGKENRRFDKSFREAKLEKAIQDVITSRVMDGNTLLKEKEDPHKGLCFVVSFRRGDNDNTPTIFRSYGRHGVEETKCETWEAARATTAAPVFFKPAKIKDGKKYAYFMDGAVKWNNPSRHVLSEAAARFPSSNRRLGCLVSLGTGLRAPSTNDDDQGERRWYQPNYKVKEIANMALNSLTDPEPPHQDIRERLRNHEDSYFRFSVPYTPNEERVRIYDHEKMEILRSNTEKYLTKRDESDKIDEIVDILCRRRVTDLTLASTCYASTPETVAETMDPLLKERKMTSSVFTGRGNILQKLDAIFEPRERGSGPRRDFLLWGIGGIGKTQISLRFIDRFADRFDRVLWIDASGAQMIQQSFEAIAFDVLRHPGPAPHIRPVINWLETTKEEWLLVIDNYDSGNIAHYLPNKRKGNVLFTSRRQNFEPQLPPRSILAITEMSLSDSTCLFLRACGLDEDDEENLEQAYPIVQELALLPLAIDAAGAHINMGTQSLDQFLASLRKERSQVLSNSPPGSEMSKNPSVYATFELSLKSIKSYARESPEQAQLSRSAIQILNTFCFYHSEGISGEMIVRANYGISSSKRWHDIGVPPEPDPRPDGRVFLGIRGGRRNVDCGYFMGGIMLLYQFSLLKQPGDTPRWSIHPLVHAWLRDRMLPGSFDRNLRLSRTILYHSYDMMNAKADRFYPSLLPHMKANNSHLFKVENTTTFWEEMDRRSVYREILKRLCHWDEVASLLEEDKVSLARALSPNDWETLDALLDLAEAYMATGKIIQAKDNLLQVFDRVSDCPSHDKAQVCYVQVCAELAMSFLVEGAFPSAQLYAERCVKYAEENKMSTVAAKTRLCLVYQYVGKWDEALALAETIFEARLRHSRQGPTHPMTWKAKAEIAYIRARLGEVDSAVEVLADTAQKLERQLGEEHYDTLAARTNLAWIYFMQNRFGEAELIQREVLETGRSVLGSGHMYTLYMMLRLGVTLGESGKHREAMRTLLECERGRKRALWESHRSVRAVAVWRVIFRGRMTGYDYRADFSETDMGMFELGKQWSELSFTPVQL